MLLYTTLTLHLHYTTLYCILHYTTLHYTLHYTTLHDPTLHYTTLHYTTTKCNWNCATLLITLHHIYNSTTLKLQLQLHCTTLHPAVVGEDQVTTATIAATPKNTTPTTFQSISGLALPSVIHNNQALL